MSFGVLRDLFVTQLATGAFSLSLPQKKCDSNICVLKKLLCVTVIFSE